VVVTGGSGRLGRSVVAALASAGHEVVSIDLALPAGGTSPAEGVISHLAVDLRDDEATAAAFAQLAPRAVVHLAAIAVPFSRPEQEILVTNVALAHSVCRSARLAGVAQVVVASSPTVMGYGAPAGWTPHYLPLDEDHPALPWNAYAVSKLTAETVMRAVAAEAGEQMHLSAVRPCFVISPEEWHGAPTQAGHSVLERLDRPELSAPALFNYLDARDAADLFLALLRRPSSLPSGDVLFAGADDALAREPLADLLPRFHPGTRHAAAALDGTRPAFSNAKAKRLLGWAPRRTWRTELAETTARRST
jgi:nucleoside-diphosphate-sugar epimerase